ncbi:NUDIX hydrolase [Balneicella halophila]|uniref:NUDIX hydrolase n=1 Tax=Balneicella halophila TaxID=1537566 RepID=UPI00140392C8|nr:NUDIX domain-containing protein [Balneicella halophila]
MNSASAVAILILNDDEELLLTKRAIEPGKGKLDLPGGFVNIGETAEDAVRRELKEELNVSAISINYFGSYPNEYVFSDVSVFTLDMAFVVKINTYTDLKAKDDVASFSFYSLNNLPVEEIAFESIRKIVKDFRLNCQKLS